MELYKYKENSVFVIKKNPKLQIRGGRYGLRVCTVPKEFAQAPDEEPASLHRDANCGFGASRARGTQQVRPGGRLRYGRLFPRSVFRASSFVFSQTSETSSTLNSEKPDADLTRSRPPRQGGWKWCSGPGQRPAFSSDLCV